MWVRSITALEKILNGLLFRFLRDTLHFAVDNPASGLYTQAGYNLD